ncbi:unnamed protein product [Penicillium egyptiacum]|uniref:Uncharacterized protein n=1 Tax=Penicillium egyptiacum TaxID=1303716 RepID=A0A9W4KK20_9EURO|nr:unnamed protein product [Penicillium egyptiacum]
MDRRLDSLPGGIDPPRAPTAEEVDIILRHYRSDVLRWHAMNLFNDQICPALLRTHYCTDEEEKARHDELMTEWVDSDPFESEAWWAVLDNADLFNFGPEWRRVYEILPDLTGPLEPEVDDGLEIPRARRAERLENFRSGLKAQIAEAKEEAPET